MLSSPPSKGRVARARGHELARANPVIAIAIAVVVTGLLGVATATAATTPKLVAKPATALTKGKTVKVTGSGFKPHDQVFLVECLAVATGQGQCDVGTATPATITAKGVLPPTKFKVVTGKIGKGSCGTKASNLKNCVINAGNASGGDTASVPIAFKAPKRVSKK
jgi:hypothetical protein